MKEILIIHTFGLGDMIMFTPTLKRLKEMYPNSRIDFLIFQKFSSASIKNCKFVNNIHYVDFNIKSIIKVVWQLRKNSYDLSLVTSGTNPLKAGIFSFLIDAKERIGEYRSMKILFYTKNIKYIENIHRVENNLYLLDIGNCKHVKPFYCLNKKIEKIQGNQIIIGLHIGSNKEFKEKRWGKEYFEKLILLLKGKYLNIITIIFSGPDEKDESKELAKNTNSELILNKPIDEVAFLISQCNIFINTDSGLGHIASCFDNIEIFTIFGPAKNYKIKPYNKNATVIKLNLECQPCYGTNRFKKCKSLKCLRDLTPNHVFELIRKESEVLNE